jgi:hypothetical protein
VRDDVVHLCAVLRRAARLGANTGGRVWQKNDVIVFAFPVDDDAKMSEI